MSVREFNPENIAVEKMSNTVLLYRNREKMSNTVLTFKNLVKIPTI